MCNDIVYLCVSFFVISFLGVGEGERGVGDSTLLTPPGRSSDAVC